MVEVWDRDKFEEIVVPLYNVSVFVVCWCFFSHFSDILIVLIVQTCVIITPPPPQKKKKKLSIKKIYSNSMTLFYIDKELTIKVFLTKCNKHDY